MMVLLNILLFEQLQPVLTFSLLVLQKLWIWKLNVGPDFVSAWLGTSCSIVMLRIIT